MEEEVQIQKLSQERLDNALHLHFHASVRDWLREADLKKIGLPKELVEEYEKCVQEEQEMIKETRARFETPHIAKKEKECNHWLSYIAAVVRAMRLSPDPDEVKAAAKKEMKEKQRKFAETLASYADVYVNDAFGTAHRAHASTALMADCFDADHKMFGYLMEKEVRAVEKVLNDINRPFTAIMGGSQVSSKIEIIENLLGKVDNLIICGGMTYTFMKALGGKIGSSICEDDKLDLALSLIEKAKARGVKLVLSSDSKIADRFSNDANTAIAPNNNIPDGWQGLDIGPETEREFADVIRSSKTILWNGPTGVFEFDNFSHGSRVVAEAIVEATKAGAYSLVGGGDSVACINKFGLADGVSYVSTGGGALLEAIEGKVLPGIKAIRGY